MLVHFENDLDRGSPYRRHDLVWLSDQAWLAILSMQSGPVVDALEAWSKAGWPTVVRRRDKDAAEHVLCIGIALPPKAGHKIRIAAHTAIDHITHHQSAVKLDMLIPYAPHLWQTGLRRFALDAQQLGCVFYVYGSLALQCITRQTYLSATSDIDLLFRPQTRSQLDAGLVILKRHAQSLPLDGEIVFPGELAVAWKEWRQCMSRGASDITQRVLVKDKHEVRLSPVRDLLASLPTVLTAPMIATEPLC